MLAPRFDCSNRVLERKRGRESLNCEVYMCVRGRYCPSSHPCRSRCWLEWGAASLPLDERNEVLRQRQDNQVVLEWGIFELLCGSCPPAHPTQLGGNGARLHISSAVAKPRAPMKRAIDSTAREAHKKGQRSSCRVSAVSWTNWSIGTHGRVSKLSVSSASRRA
jgi:hypothetical protein